MSDIYVEGLLHVTALTGDYYHFDPIKHSLKGERTGIVYRLGDQIKIQVARVDLESRQIDFTLIDETFFKEKKTSKPRKKAKKNGRHKRDR